MRKINLEDLIRVAKELGFEKQVRNTQILTIGPFTKVEFRSIGLQNFNNETLERIADAWAKHCQQVPKAFPGKVASLNSFETKEKEIIIYYNDATFDQYIGTQENGLPILDLKNPPYNKEVCLPISMGATTITADGKIPVGIRGKRKVSVTQGKAVSIPSGFSNLDKHTDSKGNFSLKALAKAELKEELFGENHWNKMEILGMIQIPDLRQPMFIVELEIPSTSEEIKQRLAKISEMDEMDEILFVDNNVEAVRNAEVNWTVDSMVKFAFHFAK